MLAFRRGIHACSTKGKEVASKVATNAFKELKGSQTIYNPRTSAANYKGYLKNKTPAGMYYNPAPSAATGSINSETIPLSFLSKDDPRRSFIKQLRAQDATESRYGPPVLVSKSTVEGKKYHLQPEQINEIIKLRSSDPVTNTRKKLAKQFGVSPLFISMVCSAPKSRITEMNERLNTIKSKWHKQREVAREDRKKRNQLWYSA
ncbi:similar to Saccharomyces cerevisiae YKR085C MRPL20 Mitochondrial ribosomal protein of the large subunit [Maudiozyma barnettii]|uniref:Similar to Saccharomyces cerevisiae YKR085C MRPL20 Mitochondrial ribosomal protein of the large subunit n=1 Tax=Maudiozyma barnettii TaxID=61262 RepID=A0A8H2VI19_9SACH|nr:mitochondrial 54S ribosomal protein YmL20 [Kazachstania barnettii]CAB4256039.1 similar to Saccharomyces cerevisiae YKR085C MRPL20 Mitochondrial ribosomal protein of the large subunit [Kazachstania barnettii]CAD1784647.1 similar to Saccharomyces cerevisiae YKR085C MRPL20 Mitochondrial ribosomal protein of the large subunit [Kazachstania barnettii]